MGELLIVLNKRFAEDWRQCLDDIVAEYEGVG